jgi:hypothetical protein
MDKEAPPDDMQADDRPQNSKEGRELFARESKVLA